MNIAKEDKPALILIDIQKGFANIEYWGGQRNNMDAEKNAGELLRLWREEDLPIFHIKHCSSNPKSLLNEANKGNEFNDAVKPMGNELVIVLYSKHKKHRKAGEKSYTNRLFSGTKAGLNY